MLTSELYLHMESTFKSLDSLPRTVFVFVFVYVFVQYWYLYFTRIVCCSSGVCRGRLVFVYVFV